MTNAVDPRWVRKYVRKPLASGWTETSGPDRNETLLPVFCTNVKPFLFLPFEIWVDCPTKWKKMDTESLFAVGEGDVVSLIQ